MVVQTVRGSVAPEQLGTTLMHEHLFAKNPELEQNYPHPEWDEEVMVARAAEQLEELARRNVTTFVDLTVLGLGRDIPRVQEVARRTSVNIVVATGCYITHRLPTFFANHGPGLLVDGPDPLERFFVTDLVDGIADTGVRAGVIKVIADHEMVTPDEERIIRAAAHAHLLTGVPISTHTHAGYRNGLAQQELFGKLGVPLERTVIGHCGDSTDLDYLRALMDNGSYIGLDRFGMEHVLDDAARIDTVVALVEAGYAERMTLSHDAGIFSVNSPPSWRSTHNPHWHHLNLSDRILPALHERGVSETALDQMLRVNAARILTPADR